MEQWHRRLGGKRAAMARRLEIELSPDGLIRALGAEVAAIAR